MASNGITVPFSGLDEQLFMECGLGESVFVDLNTGKDDEHDDAGEHEVSEMQVKPLEPDAEDIFEDSSKKAITAIGNIRDKSEDANMEFSSSTLNPIPSMPTPPLTRTSSASPCTPPSSLTSTARDQ